MTQTALLDRLESDLRQLMEQSRSQFSALPEEALLLHPGPGRWNALECFAHLNAFSDYFLPQIERAIHKSKARSWAPADERRQTWLGRMAINAVRPDNTGKKRRKSPKRMDPARLSIRPFEFKAFLINCEMLLRCIQQARQVNLNKTRVPHFRWPGFQFMLGDLLEYMVLHLQRHVIQVQATISKG